MDRPARSNALTFTIDDRLLIAIAALNGRLAVTNVTALSIKP
jgi:hypothetical protein